MEAINHANKANLPSWVAVFLLIATKTLLYSNWLEGDSPACFWLHRLCKFNITLGRFHSLPPAKCGGPTHTQTHTHTRTHQLIYTYTWRYKITCSPITHAGHILTHVSMLTYMCTHTNTHTHTHTHTHTQTQTHTHTHTHTIPAVPVKSA